MLPCKAFSFQLPTSKRISLSSRVLFFWPRWHVVISNFPSIYDVVLSCDGYRIRPWPKYLTRIFAGNSTQKPKSFSFSTMWRVKTSAFSPPFQKRRVMNCLSQFSSYTAAIFRTTGRSAGTSALCGPSSWKRRFDLCTNSKLINLESVLTRFHIQLYSSRSKGSSSKTTSPRSRKKSNPEPAMEPDKDSFYVVRKGDVVGVYKSFSDCQAQLGSSVKFTYFSPFVILMGFWMYSNWNV